MNLGRPTVYAAMLTAATFAIAGWAYAILPPGRAGLVDVSVHNPDGQSATLPLDYDFLGTKLNRVGAYDDDLGA